MKLTTDGFDDPVWCVDVETYPNFFLAGFRNLKTGEVLHFSTEPGIGMPLSELRPWFASIKGDAMLIGFNNLSYDNEMVRAAISEDGHE
jgi:hypothetical protein